MAPREWLREGPQWALEALPWAGVGQDSYPRAPRVVPQGPAASGVCPAGETGLGAAADGTPPRGGALEPGGASGRPHPRALPLGWSRVGSAFLATSQLVPVLLTGGPRSENPEGSRGDPAHTI